VPEVLDAIMKFFPLDAFVECPVGVMAVVPGDTTQPKIWEQYRSIINRYDKFSDFEYIERFAFYERARRAYAVVATSEMAPYANILLKKGLVRE
jgi:L-fucose mutarotase